jgi:uncharacterized protein YciI
MIFAVHCLDAPDSAAGRQRCLAAHSQRLRTAGFSLLTYGPLTARGGSVPVGSLFVVDADNPAEVVEFFEGDPFRVEGVWQSVTVHGFAPSRNSRVPLTTG